MIPGGFLGHFSGGETEDYPVSIVNSTGVAAAADAVQGLAPVTPNPGRDASHIRFTLVDPGRVRVAVYDLAGRRVRVLSDGPQTAGEHALTWDGRDEAGKTVRPGLYFVRMTGAGRAQTRSVVRIE